MEVPAIPPPGSGNWSRGSIPPRRPDPSLPWSVDFFEKSVLRVGGVNSRGPASRDGDPPKPRLVKIDVPIVREKISARDPAALIYESAPEKVRK